MVIDQPASIGALPLAVARDMGCPVAYGLAPATRDSGSSIRGEQPSRRGNKQLKRAFFLSAFAALADPASRTYYDKKIAQGKHHTQALLCLARRRADVFVLRDAPRRPLNQPPPHHP